MTNHGYEDGVNEQWLEQRAVHRIQGLPMTIDECHNKNNGKRPHDGGDMDMTNESYVIKISTKKMTELYYRDKDGWLKVSSRGREFRATAEQVLNHILPALAGIKPNVTIKVEHYEDPDDRILTLE